MRTYVEFRMLITCYVYFPASWQLLFEMLGRRCQKKFAFLGNMNSQDCIANIESSRIQNVSGNIFTCTPFRSTLFNLSSSNYSLNSTNERSVNGISLTILS